MTAALPLFDGATFEAARDGDRLAVQLAAVLAVMADGHWRTLRELGALAHAPEASVSARLRDLRKMKFGGHLVERKYVARGQFAYRVLVQPQLEGL